MFMLGSIFIKLVYNFLYFAIKYPLLKYVFSYFTFFWAYFLIVIICDVLCDVYVWM